ncbi:MAG: hypothetical protein ACI93T_004559 [Porticoccaceae bacterium]|jgi:hypothetical protein
MKNVLNRLRLNSATENTEATELFMRIFLCDLCVLCGKN